MRNVELVVNWFDEIYESKDYLKFEDMVNKPYKAW